MHESKTAPNNQNIVLTMSELISDDAKKSATRADVMMLAATTETEFSKLRSWISARFDTISSENTSNTDRLLRHNTFQVLAIAISAFGVIAALVANIIF
jgi:ABC-type microcin C transport system permease subunit YejB